MSIIVSPDNWSEMNCIQLIREFRARPTLWDRKDQFYYSKSVKPKLWEEISEKLNTPALECKHKMNILMSSFRRERAKIRQKQEENNGDASGHVVTWFGFKEMTFLLDKETERKRQQKEAGNVDKHIGDYNIVDDYNERTPRHKRTLTKRRTQSPTSNKQRRFSSPLQDVEKQSTNTTASTASTSAAPSLPPPTASASDIDEEIKSFANFISLKMKKYSETTKNMVQQAICEIIFKADQNFYEKNDKFLMLDERDPFEKNIDDENTSEYIKGEYDTDSYVDDDSQ